MEGDTLRAIKLTDPTNGSVTLSLDSDGYWLGGFVYTSNPTFSGLYSFTYKAYDGFDTGNVATVNLAVQPNLAPVAVDDPHIVQHNTSYTVFAPGVIWNDTDPNGDALSPTKLSDPAHGALILDLDVEALWTGGYSYWQLLARYQLCWS